MISDEMALIYFELQKTVRKLSTGAEILSQMLAGHLEWYSVVLDACDKCHQNLIDVQDQPRNWKKIFDYVNYKITDLLRSTKVTLDDHESFRRGTTPRNSYVTPEQRLGNIVKRCGDHALAKFLCASLELKEMVNAKHRIADWRVALENAKLARAHGHELQEENRVKQEILEAKAAAKENFIEFMLAQDSAGKVHIPLPIQDSAGKVHIPLAGKVHIPLPIRRAVTLNRPWPSVTLNRPWPSVTLNRPWPSVTLQPEARRSSTIFACLCIAMHCPRPSVTLHRRLSSLL